MKKNRKELPHIAKIIGYANKVKPEFLFQNTRKADVVHLRSLFHYMAKKLTRKTLKEIGDFSMKMGRPHGHHHASVLHAYHKIKGYAQIDKSFAKKLDQLEERISKVLFLEKFNSRKAIEHCEFIINQIMDEDDNEWLEALHDLISDLYKEKRKQDIVDLRNELIIKYNERIYQTSQDDTGMGVV